CLPILRRTFQLDSDIRRAIAHVCGLGHFELRVNEVKAGGDVFEPAWSDYRKTCYCVSHDVTSLLQKGENDLAVLLGNGMYNVSGGGGRYRKFKGSFGQPKLLFELRIECADGSVELIATDELWQVASGPITFSCIYGGEDFDARLA